MTADRADATDAATEAVDVIRLWPDDPPFRIDDVGAEVAYPAPGGPAVGTTFLRNVSEPTLTVFTPPAGARTVGA